MAIDGGGIDKRRAAVNRIAEDRLSDYWSGGGRIPAKAGGATVAIVVLGGVHGDHFARLASRSQDR